MDRHAIIERLRARQERLNALGIVGLSLFGSAARGEADGDSDVDIAVKLDERFSGGGFDYFAKMDALRSELASALGRSVDIVEEPVGKTEFQANIDKDRIIAFP